MHPDELYALPPEEFTAARDDAAKAAKKAGDAARAKELKALRRPSVSAWLVNLLAARENELLEQLLALGPALAEAQASGHSDELRELGAQRRELVEAVTGRAVALADRDVTATVRQEVSATLDTALADPEAAQAVRTGRLVRPLSYAGFGGVDLDGAVAVSRPQPVQENGAVAAAEAAALEAAGRLDDAVRACERLERERGHAEQQAAQAEQAGQDAKRALADAERREKTARETRTAAEQAAAAARQAVQEAQDAAEQARAALDRLRRRE